MRLACVGLVSVMLASAPVAAAVSPLASLFGTASSFGIVYAEPPKNATFMFYVGEPVELELKIVNTVGNPQEFLCRGGSPGESIDVTVSRAGVTVPVMLNVAPASQSVTTGAVTRFRTLPGPIPLESGEYLRWHLTVTTDSLEPGVYLVQAVPACRDGDGNPIRRRDTRFDFELREPTADSQAELLRREGYRYFSAQRLNDAEAAAARLLRVNAASYAAHQLLGDIARARRDRVAVRREFRAAADILANGQDALFLRFNEPWKAADVAQALRRRGEVD
jgi:hypothetical protein